MTQLANNFEGGTAGVTITPGNSGGASGDAFDGVDSAVGAAVQFSSTAYSGSVAMQAGTRGAAGLTGVHWQSSVGTLADFYGRFFFRITAIPSLNDDILMMLDPLLATTIGKIRFLASAHIDIKDTSDVTQATSSTTFSANTWYRIEYHVHTAVGVNAGYVTVRIYTDPLAPVASFTEELNGGGASPWTMGVANTGYIAHLGGNNNTNWPTSTDFAIFDGIVTGAPTTWVGPEAANPPTFPVWPRLRYND